MSFRFLKKKKTHFTLEWSQLSQNTQDFDQSSSQMTFFFFQYIKVVIALLYQP